ncbi:type IV toxin-antitoxin system AbiEi family antitoxin [Microlunatus speluncae]|uniref:type IV toxin-antitoxin system AbiEi family antitoxin n=1 Tax=Microlunatus speluncae TaxID=2594267 RepID=UPI001375E4E0|nr:type IV toxin-antitoxin system AbiEi family antitoxin [Microlunatus speluncae]
MLIDVRGRSRPADTDGPVQPVGNLLSTGRAQVVFVLMAWPELWHGSRRELAQAAGVSVGQAHNTVSMLTELGYQDGAELPGQASLLDLWAASFPVGLARRLTLGAFRGELDPVRGANAQDQVLVSGEQAVEDLIRPTTLIVYVAELDPRLPLVNRWRADGPSNITVRRKFWDAPDRNDEDPAVTVAPWPLVYADLLSSDDPRVRSAAIEWKDRHVRPEQRPR